MGDEGRVEREMDVRVHFLLFTLTAWVWGRKGALLAAPSSYIPSKHCWQVQWERGLASPNRGLQSESDYTRVGDFATNKTNLLLVLYDSWHTALSLLSAYDTNAISLSPHFSPQKHELWRQWSGREIATADWLLTPSNRTVCSLSKYGPNRGEF